MGQATSVLTLFQPPVTGSSKTTSGSPEASSDTTGNVTKTRSARSKKRSMENYMELILDRLRSIETQMSADRASAEERRRETHREINGMKLSVQQITMRLDQLEGRFEEIAPAMKEFSTMKTQAIGAGRLGRGLWTAGGVILGGALWLATFWDNLVKFLARLISPGP